MGLDLETVKLRLEGDTLFRYRGDPDVSLLVSSEQPVIETAGADFIERAFFQFEEGLLFIITLLLNTDELDYFTLYTTLSERYGESQDLTPQRVLWASADTMLVLEQPLTIKYIDRPTFDRLREAVEKERAGRALAREEFLELF